MQKYTDVITSARSGAAIPNARVTVKTYPGDVAATIYSDDGITTQDNPITTDARGQFSFYAADGRYSLVVSGTGITEQTLTDHVLLADPDDGDAEQSAADVTFTPSGSGTSPQTVELKLLQAKSLLDYIPNGTVAHSTIRGRTVTADLSTYITAAIDDMAAKGGGVLLAPSGYYPHASNLIMKSGVWIVGEGYGTHFHNTAVDGRSFQNENRGESFAGAVEDENIGLFNFRVTNNKAGSTDENSHCVDLRYIRGLFLDQLWLDDARGDGAYLRGCEGAEVGTLYIGDTTRQGLSVTSGTQYRIGRVLGIECDANNLVDIEPNPADTIDGIEIGRVEVISGDANAFNVHCDTDNAIEGMKIGYVKTKNVIVRGVQKGRIDWMHVEPTATTDIACAINRVFGFDIGRLDIPAASIDKGKLSLSTVDDCHIDVLNVVGPGGATNVCIDVVTTNRCSIGKVYGTAGGVYGLRVRNSHDFDIGKYVMDGAGTYGFLIASTTSNGNIRIRGIKVTGYPTGGRVEGTSNIVELDGDLSACATPLSVSGTQYLLADRLKGYSMRQFVGSAAPTAGSWERGNIITQRQPAAGGAIQWACISTGTFGAATDNTGDTDGSTGVITGMTDTSDFNVGDWVNVSAGFASTGPFLLLSKTSTSITVRGTSNSAQSNVTVDTTDPLFKADRVRGTFTLDADASTTVADTNVLATSVIVLMPTNAAAATLMQSTESLYVSNRTAGTSFAVSTADGGAAAGTETFNYMILN